MSVVLPGYRVLGTLGKGARSTIYHVVETKTGQDFALKRVVRRTAEDDPFLRQVEIEYDVTSKILHPYLRRSFALHRKREWMQIKELFLLSEYVEGFTVEQRRPPRLDLFLSLFRRVAAGLDALHAGGYIHADVKPRNILWKPGGIVKIIDFGQSCRVGQRKERIQGTPDYIAPEQVKRNALDQRTDIFNVGASMYWVLTAKAYPTLLDGLLLGGTAGTSNRPPAGVDLVRAPLAISEPSPLTPGLASGAGAAPLTPRQINRKIPQALSQLVMECCRTNPAERPADMKTLEKRLTAIQNRWRKAHPSSARLPFTSRAGIKGKEAGFGPARRAAAPPEQRGDR